MTTHLAGLEHSLVQATVRYIEALDDYTLHVDSDMEADEQFAQVVTEYHAARDAMHQQAHTLIAERKAKPICHVCGGIPSISTRDCTADNGPVLYWCVTHFWQGHDARLTASEAPNGR